jgi:hypothetical protein
MNRFLLAVIAASLLQSAAFAGQTLPSDEGHGDAPRQTWVCPPLVDLSAAESPAALIRPRVPARDAERCPGDTDIRGLRFPYCECEWRCSPPLRICPSGTGPE